MNLMKTRLPRRQSAAFTLIELMVVLIVIGILAATIIPRFVGASHDAKVTAAKSDVTVLANAVNRFYYNLDRYPTAEEGLKILIEAPAGEEASKWRGPYLEQLRNDPWSHPYQYRVPGTHHPTSFDIYSWGADGAEGGEKENEDIGNW
jgi:general secretion pathway protein G